MMRNIVKVAGLLLVVIAIVVIVGASLPVKHTVTRHSATIDKYLEAVGTRYPRVPVAS